MGRTNGRSMLDELGRNVSVLAPCILGLAFARIGQEALAVCMNGGGILPSVSTTLARGATLVVLGILLLVHGRRLRKRFVNRFAQVCIGGHLLCLLWLMVTASLPLEGIGAAEAYLLGNCFSVLCLFYWFRRMREARPALLIVAVGSARAIYEIYLAIVPFAPPMPIVAIGAAMICVEYGCILWARRNVRPAAIAKEASDGNYVTRNDKEFQELRFVLICLLACFLISTAYDMLRTDPSGGKFYADPLARLAASVIVCAFLAVAILTASRSTSFLRTTYSIAGIIVLAATALFLFALMPAFPQPGVACITAANALKDTLKWYFIVAFMSIGKRDPYLYATAIWLVFMAPILIDRGLLDILATAGFPITSALIHGFATFTLTIGACLFMVCFARLVVNDDEAPPPEPSPFLKNLIGNAQPTMNTIKRSAMSTDIDALGDQFLLSEREREIAALYALGHTQAAIAEELRISKTTVHTHIGHIYEKTGLHSRQDILDYLKDYGA